MIVLVINTNKTFLKYQLINPETGAVLAKGHCDRIGLGKSTITHFRLNQTPVTFPASIPDIKAAVNTVIQILTSSKRGVIKRKEEIDAVGHRIVHGGERFAASAIITSEIKRAIESCYDLAPLHNPPSIAGIHACEEALPGVPQVSVFDTAFHQTMPEYASMYALPYAYYEKHGIRKYGFHGTSHFYVSQRAAEMLGKPYESLKIISCHLGFGSSIAAVKNGRSVDTSMGLTPLAGICMCTRCGDIDPAIVTFLMEKENLDHEAIDDLMNNRSGVLGVSGVSSDFRDLYEAAGHGNPRAALALDLFKYQCRKFIGAYAAAMGGVDVVTFTAGIGENAPDIRFGACHGLEFMGIAVDPYRNAATIGKEAIISADESSVKVLVIPTKEELVIALETAKVCGFSVPGTFSAIADS